MDHEPDLEERIDRLEEKMVWAVKLLNRILAKANRHLQGCSECEDAGDALAHLRSAS